MSWGTDGPTSEARTVVDIVQRIPKGSQEDFPGIYAAHVTLLPDRCWSADSTHVFFSTPWRSRLEIIGVDVDSGQVKRLTNDRLYPCYRIVEACHDYVLAMRSNPVTPPSLVLGAWNGETSELTWESLDHLQLPNPLVRYPCFLSIFLFSLFCLEPHRISLSGRQCRLTSAIQSSTSM